MTSGYTYCSCRDCFEITIGETGKAAFCHACEAAGCEAGRDCQADHCAACGAFETAPDGCKGCEYGGAS